MRSHASLAGACGDALPRRPRLGQREDKGLVNGSAVHRGEEVTWWAELRRQRPRGGEEALGLPRRLELVPWIVLSSFLTIYRSHCLLSLASVKTS